MAIETSFAPRGPERSAERVEDDYQSFCEALGASARGRAFLHEYAKRNRHADTEVVLTALARIEQTARNNRAAPEAERIRQELRALLDTIHAARPQLDQTPGAIKAATLSALIEFVQARIEAVIAMGTAAPVMEVPPSDQPELPIPRPGLSATRSIALVPAPLPPSASVDQPSLLPSGHDSMPLAFRPRETVRPSRLAQPIPAIDFIEGLFDEMSAKVLFDDASPAQAELPEAQSPVPEPALVAEAVAVFLAETPAVAEQATPEQATVEIAEQEALPAPEMLLEPAIAIAPQDDVALEPETAVEAEIVPVAVEAVAPQQSTSVAASETDAVVDAPVDVTEPAQAIQEAVPPETGAPLTVVALTAFVQAAIDQAQAAAHESERPAVAPLAAESALAAIAALSEDERIALFT